ncbi:MOSC domain-containing protein [Streptomyces sp. A1136]|uniref:MOSC domain-containing protein n=1 Tax=Streptomyces sp. A1136 TaxID=2563102 RepID=UPI00109EB2B4|nr:MOSC domain-containing protein [Streptomyces sp. A1136]THA58014.1 MOSC domain-containing protein [Streptomyces sp. A1136]
MSGSYGSVLSVNVGRARAVPYTDAPGGATGIDKQPVDGPVRVDPAGPPGVAGSGVSGDAVCDPRFHGGADRAVYAFAREELDDWQRELNRVLGSGSFGENLTVLGMDLRHALIGERWRVGPDAVVEVTGGRIPCRTFAGWLGEKGWVRRFTRAGSPGAMLRVIEAGEISAGDHITVVHRPDHDVTVSRLFRAVTTERSMLPDVLVAALWMEREQLEIARQYTAKLATRADR